ICGATSAPSSRACASARAGCWPMPDTQTNGHRPQVRLPIAAKSRPKREECSDPNLRHFDEAETRIAVALAEAILPGGTNFLPRRSEPTARKLEEMLAPFGSRAVRHYGGLLRTLEQMVRPFARGRAFTALHEYERARLLGEWADHADPVRRSFTLGLTAPMKV